MERASANLPDVEKNCPSLCIHFPSFFLSFFLSIFLSLSLSLSLSLCFPLERDLCPSPSSLFSVSLTSNFVVTFLPFSLGLGFFHSFLPPLPLLLTTSLFFLSRCAFFPLHLSFQSQQIWIFLFLYRPIFLSHCLSRPSVHLDLSKCLCLSFLENVLFVAANLPLTAFDRQIKWVFCSMWGSKWHLLVKQSNHRTNCNRTSLRTNDAGGAPWIQDWSSPLP